MLIVGIDGVVGVDALGLDAIDGRCVGGVPGRGVVCVGVDSAAGALAGVGDGSADGICTGSFAVGVLVFLLGTTGVGEALRFGPGTFGSTGIEVSISSMLTRSRRRVLRSCASSLCAANDSLSAACCVSFAALADLVSITWIFTAACSLTVLCRCSAFHEVSIKESKLIISFVVKTFHIVGKCSTTRNGRLLATVCQRGGP